MSGKRIVIMVLVCSFAMMLVSCGISSKKQADVNTEAESSSMEETEAKFEEETMTEASKPEPVIINVKENGAVGDGVTDDTEAIRAALKAVKETGGEVYFPEGTYLVTKSLAFSGKNIKIYGDGNTSKIIYTYQQRGSDTFPKPSLFFGSKGPENISFSDLYLEYQGDFFESELSRYDGCIHGIALLGVQGATFERLEITGFNASGIYVDGVSTYSTDVTVRDCYLHHNRVAGVLYGNVDGILITECLMEYMGSQESGGTGYGCSGYSNAIPKNVQIINNDANYNYRKGIDLHAGMDVLIENNRCHANRLYGIYAEGPSTTRITIKNNVITGMHKDELDIGEPYTWIEGIAVGAATAYRDTFYDYEIVGNVIEDFGLGEGEAHGIKVYRSADRVKGNIVIRDNKISGKDITDFINCGDFITGTGETDLKFTIENNTFYTESLDETAFRIFEYNDMIFRNNEIHIAVAPDVPVFTILHDNTCTKTDISNNTIAMPANMSEYNDISLYTENFTYESNIVSNGVDG